MASSVDDALEEHVTNFINTSKALPKDYPYDWKPFLKAISEGFVAPKDQTGVQTLVPIKDGDVEDKGNGHQTVSDVSTKKVNPIKTVPKIPKTGSWDYTFYIPEWSHPDYDPDYQTRYRGHKYLANRDVVHNLRPALRADDAFKRPTQYALRFGIHPHEPGGRSRVSPTTAESRDPGVDITSQMDMLNENDKKFVIERSKRFAELLNEKYDASSYTSGIDARVLDEIVGKYGAMSASGLQKDLREFIGGAGNNLEQYVVNLDRDNQRGLQAHRIFLKNALNDQDYQRLLFQDLTTDELIRGNIHTMSDDVICDLQGEIHPLFQKSRWDDCSAKGASILDPRMLYNLNGERQEWNVQTNDLLWNALQPALQLVTRVINSGPPGLNSLIDMRTRQPLDASKDGREEPETPFITRFVQTKDIDMDKTYPGIRNLNAMGYDWNENTMRVLDRCFRLDICSAYISPGQSEEDKPTEREQQSYAYGCTTSMPAKTDSTITSYISAEIIWPLLVPQYSQSEKMSSSFQIASTLLHEFAHAVSMAQQMLTREDWLQPGDQDDEISKELFGLNEELWDDSCFNAEPVFEDCPLGEVGFDMEKSLFGFVGVSMLSNYSSMISRYLMTFSIMTLATQWPFGSDEPWGPILGGTFYPENYSIPVPLDYMAKFFTQNFWDVEFPKYGWEALKIWPTDRVHKVSMYETVSTSTEMSQYFGASRYGFLRAVFSLLKVNGFTILSVYLSSSIKDLMRPQILLKRWELEVKTWNDDRLFPLPGLFRRLVGKLNRSQIVNSQKLGDSLQGYGRYIEKWTKDSKGDVNHPPPMGIDQWKQDIDTEWNNLFREGGEIMVLLSQTHRELQTELAYMQRMIVDYFQLDQKQRAKVYSGQGYLDPGPMGQAFDRMSTYRQRSKNIAMTIHGLAQQEWVLPIRDQYERWANLFHSSFTRYSELLDMLTSGKEYRVGDVTWKANLTAVPSSYWRNRSDRLRQLAHQEYLRADPRIRGVLDDFDKVVYTFKNEFMFPTREQPEVKDLAGALANVRDLGTSSTAANTGTLFDWAPKGQQQVPIAYDGTWQQASSTYQASAQQPQQAPQAGAGPSIGVQAPPAPVFGQPSTPFNPARELGAAPPRRASNMGPGKIGSNDKSEGSPSPALGPIGNTTIRKNNHDNAFGKYTTGGSNTGDNFIKSMAKFGQTETLVAAGVPTNTINTALQGFGPGGKIVPATTAPVFSPAPNPLMASPIPLFPSPYALSNTLTPDVQAYNEYLKQNEASNTLANMQTGKPYAAAGLWRETMGMNESDGSSSGNSPPPQ
ncbi:hypothetical protein F5B20DRAFT_245791 [Whalleya microplaca]|nr:hypothetical protein F5B20DRAFT_245791 [Whalleya microplaca]